MFFRIYLGIIFSILSCIVVSYFIYETVNDRRLLRYNQEIYAGTLELVKQGVSRYQEPRRTEWLSIIRNLSSLNFELKSSSDLNLESHERQQLNRGHILFRASKQVDEYEALAPVGRDGKQIIAVALDRVTERQLRVPALLLINELSRVNNEKRSEYLKELSGFFSFPIFIAEIDTLSLDRSQRSRLDKGDIVIDLQLTGNAKENLKVFTLIEQQKPGVLVLGSIPVFENISLWLAISLILFSLMVMGVAAYIMVRRIELRLKGMAGTMHQFGSGELEARAAVRGDDTVAELAEQFNGMAGRISELILEQKHLTQSVSHELRTPITRMKFRLDMLSETVSSGLGSSEEQRANEEKISGVKRDLDELNRLVDETLVFQTLDASKAAGGVQGYVLESLALPELVAELKEELQAQRGEKEIRFSDDQVHVLAYGHYLKRALLNLVANGLRYCRSQVVIEYNSTPELHQLSVSDDGGGISEEYWDTIFQPFHRVDNSRSKDSGGYGLGLAIVQRIAKLHKGRVFLQKGASSGACFVLEWPKKPYKSEL